MARRRRRSISFLDFAQRSNGRGGPRRARAPSLEAPVAPVRAYELGQGETQV